jgi:hypothetical protein
MKEIIMTAKVLNYDFEGFFTTTALVRNTSGVYVIVDCTARGNSLLDVGESGALQTRLNSHDRAECWKRHCKGTVKVAVLYANGQSRKMIADEIRDRLHPTCGVR